MIHLTLQVAAAICLSCRPDATSPLRTRNAAFEVQTPQPVAGCARISVHVDLNTNAVTVQDGATCGQLVPERDTQPVFDASRRALRLPIVLRNATNGYVTAPVRVSFTADSIYRSRNGQPVPGSGSTRTLNADSAIVNGRVATWRYDSLLAVAGETQRLAPGARSRRLWLEFTGPELWMSPGGADADTTLSLRLDASGFFQIVTEVPAVAPDTAPLGFLDEANLTSDARSPNRFVRDVVVVLFRRGTSQEARAAAIAGVSGDVVGGIRMDGVDGMYYVRLPTDPTNDRVFEAIRILQSHPAVAAADLKAVLFDAISYLKPGDDFSGWGRAVWKLSKDSAYIGTVRNSWALEAVNAPRAWGCSVGDQTVRIAVIDQGMRTINLPDLSANNQLIQNGNFLNDTSEHGVRVSHVLAARGDNGVAMSGMMWRAATYLYDVTPRLPTGAPRLNAAGQHYTDPNDVVRAIVAAANAGARVINFSMAARVPTPLTPIPPVQDSAVRRSMGVIVQNLATFAQGRTPLIVISTGITPGATAHYAQWPILADSLPGQVLNVAASNRARLLMFVPPNSPLVDVAAPGDSVGTWATGGGSRESGTSFSTPLVAGVAGLLMAFDSTLTTAEVRNLVIQGAAAGGDSAGGVPILDAYESLRLAAQRPGAPLCGNRLWSDSGVVVAERVLASGAVAETLTVVPAGIAPTYLAPIHGGKRLFNGGFGATWRELNWMPGAGWAVVAPTPVTDTAIGGTYWSSRSLDHDRTRILFATPVVTSPGSPATLNYNFTLSPTPPSLTLSSSPVRAGVDSSAAVCIKILGSGSCGFLKYPFYHSKVSVAMSPDGNRGFYAVTEIVNRVVASGPTNTCPDDTFAQCIEHDIITEPTGPTELFEINFAANAAVQRWSVQGYVFRLGMSERNDEVVTTEGEQRFIQHFGWTGVHGFDEPFVASSSFNPNTCLTLFRDVRPTTTTWGQVRRQVVVRPSTACTLDTGKDGIGGIAPRIRRTP